MCQKHIAHCTLLVLLTIGCGPPPSDTPTARSGAQISWITIPTDSGDVRVAIARPSAPGPFPAVLILHGTHGFAHEYVALARDLAELGVLSFAACWFNGASGAGQRFITPIPCDRGPTFVDAPGSDRFRLSRITIEQLVKALRANPDVRGLAGFGRTR